MRFIAIRIIPPTGATSGFALVLPTPPQGGVILLSRRLPEFPKSLPRLFQQTLEVESKRPSVLCEGRFGGGSFFCGMSPHQLACGLRPCLVDSPSRGEWLLGVLQGEKVLARPARLFQQPHLGKAPSGQARGLGQARRPRTGAEARPLWRTISKVGQGYSTTPSKGSDC